MNPPFHADHVGSLLRPPELVAARKAKSANLRQIEDDAIRRAVAQQEAIGLQSVTDGEFRRDYWHLDFMKQLDGVTLKAAVGMTFAADITGMLTVDSLIHGRFDVFGEALRYLLLPAFALCSTTLGQIALTTRASMIDVSSQDYMEASRAFGVPEFLRVVKYMLRPAFVPPLTILGLSFAALIGHAFVVELIFAWPGMASYGIRAILQKDLNAVMGVVMVSGVFFVMVNLLIDVLVGIVDPRVRIQGSRR